MPSFDLYIFSNQITFTVISFFIIYMLVDYIIIPKVEIHRKLINVLNQPQKKYDIISLVYKIILKKH
jgi:hypothetical protein